MIPNEAVSPKGLLFGVSHVRNWTASRMRSAISRALPRGARGRMTANSSPPYRATGSVVLTNPREKLGKLAENGIPSAVAIEIVDGFEVIDVGDHEAERHLLRVGQRDLLLQFFVEFLLLAILVRGSMEASFSAIFAFCRNCLASACACSSSDVSRW
ncbi:MAG TPA: hypothetical protein VHC71_11770 [Hyphomicrobium sp.]|jgi:hypothetical protein|nr:hypothetical protein [Hyphomicrobium sp.]